MRLRVGNFTVATSKLTPAISPWTTAVITVSQKTMFIGHPRPVKDCIDSMM
jgi:hypothetical protein